MWSLVFLNKSTDPQCLPITSRINVLWWLRVEEYGYITADVCFSFTQWCHGGWGDLCAVVVMASTTSMMRCRAESVPMVMSVPQKSLSMEPTMPTMFRWEDFFASCSVIIPVEEGSGITVDPNATLNSSFSTVNLLRSRDYLLARGQPAARSTQSWIRWHRSGCRHLRSHTGWWCPASLGCWRLSYDPP